MTLLAFHTVQQCKQWMSNCGSNHYANWSSKGHLWWMNPHEPHIMWLGLLSGPILDFSICTHASEVLSSQIWSVCVCVCVCGGESMCVWGGESGGCSPASSSSLKNSSLSLAECDFFISARVRGTFLRSDGEKKDGRLRSGVGGVLNDVICVVEGEGGWSSRWWVVCIDADMLVHCYQVVRKTS